MTKGSGSVVNLLARKVEELWSGGKVNVQNRINYDYLLIFDCLTFILIDRLEDGSVCRYISLVLLLLHYFPLNARNSSTYALAMGNSIFNVNEISLTKRGLTNILYKGHQTWLDDQVVLFWTGDLHISQTVTGLVSHLPRFDASPIKSYLKFQELQCPRDKGLWAEDIHSHFHQSNRRGTNPSITMKVIIGHYFVIHYRTWQASNKHHGKHNCPVLLLTICLHLKKKFGSCERDLDWRGERVAHFNK